MHPDPTSMTTTRTAAEALEHLQRQRPDSFHSDLSDLRDYQRLCADWIEEFAWDVEKALRAALAQPAPAQEPVAFMFAVRYTGKGRMSEFAAIDYSEQEGEEIIAKHPLVYAAPPPEVGAKLYAAPPPPPAQEPVDVAASSIRNGSTNKGDKMINYTGRHKDSFDRFFASTQKEKPVGWRKDLNPPHGNFTLQWLEENPWPEQNHVQPLYAAPPQDEARELLDEAILYVRGDAESGYEDAVQLHERIRAYLEKHK